MFDRPKKVDVERLKQMNHDKEDQLTLKQGVIKNINHLEDIKKEVSLSSFCRLFQVTGAK